jgi:hypothetical protein
LILERKPSKMSVGRSAQQKAYETAQHIITPFGYKMIINSCCAQFICQSFSEPLNRAVGLYHPSAHLP